MYSPVIRTKEGAALVTLVVAPSGRGEAHVASGDMQQEALFF